MQNHSQKRFRSCFEKADTQNTVSQLQHLYRKNYNYPSKPNLQTILVVFKLNRVKNGNTVGK